jgi:hypothetical protein
MNPKAKKVTTVRRKNIAVPVTSLEKYERLLIINPDLDKLKDVFGLEIEL